MSFLISLLTGLGVGSGGLFVLWLVFSKDIAQAEAQGLNLIFFSCSILASTLVNIHYRRVVGEVLFPLLLFGTLAGIPAGLLAGKISSEILSRLFGAFLISAGVWGLVSGAK